MALKKELKQEIISNNQRKAKDTGSVEVQVALLTEEIKQLTTHLLTHKKDKHSRRGLYKKVNTRKSLLAYLKKEDLVRYEKLLKKLELRK